MPVPAQTPPRRVSTKQWRVPAPLGRVPARLGRVKAPLWLALVLAALAGLLLDLGFPDVGLWPLPFVGIALFVFTLIGRSLPIALLLGAITGAVFYGWHITWATIYLGPVPWIALTLAMTISFALGAVLIALALRLAERWSGLAQLLALPLLVAGLWTAREWFASVLPYGGFAWGRMAESQSESPFAPLVAYLGLSGLTAVMVWLSVLTLQAIRLGSRVVGSNAADSSAAGSSVAPALSLPWRVLSPLVLVAIMLVIPAWQPQLTGSANVGLVQGNADAALNSKNPRGTILRKHLDATQALFGQQLDLLVWPENGSDMDPLRYPEAAQALSALTEHFNAPMVVGTITKRGDEFFNTALLWDAGVGMRDWYDKKHPVPFAEYVPDRAFFRLLAPDLIDLVTRDYVHGSRDAIFELKGFAAGVAICFDIVDDDLMIGMVRDGAEMILVPTNNADFGHTDQHLQQFAIAKLRAIETGRSVVHVSTVGKTAVVAPDGTVLDQLPSFEAGAMIVKVPTATGITPAVAMGRALEATISLLALAALLGLGLAQAPIFSSPRRERR